jgi:hypothetical protein
MRFINKWEVRVFQRLPSYQSMLLALNFIKLSHLDLISYKIKFKVCLSAVYSQPDTY